MRTGDLGLFFMLSPSFIKASAMHHSKNYQFTSVYETIAQHQASQTRPLVIWIWTFWEIAPNSSLLLVYKTKTSFHFPVPFLPVYLLHLLTDILSGRPERWTGSLSLVGLQTADVVPSLETIISLSPSCSVSSLSVVAFFEFELHSIVIFIARWNLK